MDFFQIDPAYSQTFFLYLPLHGAHEVQNVSA